MFSDRLKRHSILFLAALLGIALPPSLLAQTTQGTAREIISEDFTKNRQKAAPANKESQAQASTAAPSRPGPPRRTYRPATAAASNPQPKTRPAVVAQLGITIWRLRPSVANDKGARMLVREKSKTAEWVPERVEADTIFREGDQIRLSIESPQPGYLYVIDRDLLSDGSTGRAMLIYPWAGMHGGDNQVGPGKLIDIPAQEDDPGYFTARRSSPNQAGEILSIIVTTSPLDLAISDKPLQISNVELARWEKAWGGQSERFEMEGGAGEVWTHAEQQAAHTGGRQLTREDPSPQTIYRVSVADNKALLVNVRLRYSN